MNNLNIQYFLRSKPIEDALKDLEELGVYAKKHPDYPELYQFNYDMIESSNHKNHPIVMECRGIILNSNKNWEVVAYPFNRFCNAGENFNYEIDWSTARIQEKFDGSLMIVYFYADKWQVATRNSPNACGNVGNYDFTFAELFWKTFMDLTYSSGKLIPCCTYMFELMSPFNRVVVEQKDNSLVLIGVRNNNNFQELNLDKCIFDEFLFVRSYSVRNLSNVILAASKLNPLQQEGFVIVDDKFNRIKVKCPKYVLIHHMKDGFSTRRMIDLIKLGEKSELHGSYYDLFQLGTALRIYYATRPGHSNIATERDVWCRKSICQWRVGWY